MTTDPDITTYETYASHLFFDSDEPDVGEELLQIAHQEAEKVEEVSSFFSYLWNELQCSPWKFL